MIARDKATLTSLPTGEVARWISALDQAAAAPEMRSLDRSVSALRAAASVLTGFDPATLVPWSPPSPFDDKARLSFLTDLATIEGAEPRFGCRLERGVRRTALEQLKGGTADATRKQLQAVLAINERSAHPTQKMLEAAIEGTIPPLQTMGRDDLVSLAAVAEWLDGILEDLPRPAELQRLIARSDLLDPLQRLAGDHFVGREDELRRLADHVGALEIDRSAGVFESFGQAVRRGRNVLAEAFGQRRPLFVHGPGGVGKSSLLAKFVLNHTSASGYEIPFVLIDVDRPNVDPLRPLTFLAAGLEQLAQQLEGIQRPARQLAAEILESLRGRDTAALESVVDTSENLIREFVDVISSPLRGRPLLFIVDTFEEVQFLGPDAVRLIVHFLARLQEEMSAVRIVVSGRSAPGDPSFYVLSLPELPPEPAAQLLSRVLIKAKRTPPPPEQLNEVVDAVGGNPMVLNLAARLIAEEDIEGALASGERDWLRRVRVEATQARLYGRVLRHIHDKEARKLAVPGLLVRRVNTAIVLEVLAGPCELEVKDAEAAQALVNALGKEMAIVSLDRQDGSLVYRADIRRLMLEAIGSSVKEDLAREIDENAIAFWLKREGPIARAEELYHRLRRDRSSAELDARWDPVAEVALRSAFGEIPASAQRWLANKLGITVTEGSRLEALQPEWEEHAARTARRLLADAQPTEALKVLRERPERIGSSVPALEVRALYALDRIEESLEVAQEGAVRAKDDGDAPGQVELLLLSALAYEAVGRLSEARIAADVATDVAEQAGLSEWLLRALVQSLRLLRHTGHDTSGEAHRRRSVALGLIGEIGMAEIERDAALLRDAAAELGAESPTLLQRAIEEVGSDVIRTSTREDQRTVLEQFGNVAPQVIDEIIGGNLYELAKLGSQALLGALFGNRASKSDPVGIAVRLLRGASERAMQRTGDPNYRLGLGSSRRPVATLNLNGTQKAALAKEIERRLPRDELQRALLYFTQRELEDYASPSEPYAMQVVRLIEAADREGWLASLVDSLDSRNAPGDTFLKSSS